MDALAYGCGNRLNWPHPSIFHLSELYTYPNEFVVAVGNRGSDKRGSTVRWRSQSKEASRAERKWWGLFVSAPKQAREISFAWAGIGCADTTIPRQQPLPKPSDKHGSHEHSNLFRIQSPYLPRQLTHELNVSHKNFFAVQPPTHENFYTKYFDTKFYYMKISRFTVQKCLRNPANLQRPQQYTTPHGVCVASLAYTRVANLMTTVDPRLSQLRLSEPSITRIASKPN